MRYIALIFGLLFAFSQNANAAVTVNSTGSAVGYVAGNTPLTYANETVAAGANMALIVVMTFDNAVVPPGIAATWNGVSMTLLTSVANGANASAAIFGLRNPATGNQTVSVSWTGGGSFAIYIDAIAFNGVDQTSDATAFPVAGRVSNTGATTALTLTIPSSASDYCVQANGLAPVQHRTANSDTELFYSTLGTGNGESQYGVGAASKVMTATLDTSSAWASVGVDVAAVAAGSVPLFRSLMGVGQ